MSKIPVVSIIIVDYFKASRVIDNVKAAIQQSGGGGVEVIVIDNSCDEGNRLILEQIEGVANVTLRYSDSNLGYIAACNLGVELSSGDYIFLVNPDIVWKSNDIVLRVVARFKEDSKLGIIGTRQVNDDGSTPDTVRAFPDLIAQIARRTFLRKLPLFCRKVSEYEVSDFNYAITSDVDWVQSSFMAIKRDTWNEVGGLDNRFYLFMSDPDICYQAWAHGYRVLYDAEIQVGADGKRCSAGGASSIFKSPAVRSHIKDAFAYQLKYFFKDKSPSKLKVTG